MASLSKKKKLLIYEMINKGFSDKDIGRMVDVPGDVIKTFRGGKNVKENGKNKNDKGSRNNDNADMQRGAGDSSNLGNKAGRGQSEFDNEDNNATGEGTSGKTGDGITFVGGKKDMEKKEGSGAKEEDEYQCYNCDYTQGSPFSDCPKCGSSNTFDE